jgi:serine/threonine protein kinase
MYELIIGAPPFLEQTTKKTQIRIQNLDIKYPKTISKNAKNLLQKLLVINPQERLSLNNVIQHPWIIQNATHTSDYI